MSGAGAPRHAGYFMKTPFRPERFIAETIFYTELFHAMRAKSIRNKKSFRDN
jgi:hypothetical protein